MLDEEERKGLTERAKSVVQKGDGRKWIDEDKGMFEYPYKTTLVSGERDRFLFEACARYLIILPSALEGRRETTVGMKGIEILGAAAASGEQYCNSNVYNTYRVNSFIGRRLSPPRKS